MSFIQQFFTSRDNNANAETFVGQQGRLWWDPVTNQIYSSDGNTPGGIPLAGGGGGNGTPGGSNSQVQFNDSGAFGGTANLTINSATGALTAVSFVGDGSTLTNVTGANVVGEVAYAAVANSVAGANVSGAVANATYATSAGSATTATTAGTVTANAQPNITSVGTLNSVSVSGNVDTGGLYVGGSGVVTGNLQIQGNLTYNNLTNITTANLVFGLANTSVGVSANGAGWVVGNTNQASWLYNFGTQQWNSNIGISAIGNIIGSNITTGGLISAAGNVSGGNLRTTGVVSATGGIISNGEIYSATAVTGGNVSGATLFATGNITGGNILTNGLISATGNITGGNVNLNSGRFAGGSLSVLGSVTGGGLSTAGNLSVSGNAAVGNLSATGSINLAGRISAVGNITGGNLLTGANVSATGNVTGGNVISNGLITTVSNVVANYFVGNGAALYSITGANVVGAVTDAIYASSAVNAINAETVTANSQPNITGVGILTSLSVSGNVDAAYFIGNGSQLTGIASSSGNRIFNGTSNVEIATADGNATITTAGASTWTFDTAGTLNLPGGNIVQAVDNDLNIVVQDADDDDFALQLIVDDGAGTSLSRIQQRRNNIQLGVGLGSSPYFWEFVNGGTLRLPGDVWGTAGGNLTVLVPISGADSFISLQTRDNTDTLKSNINVTTTNVTISTNTAGNTWVFDNAGSLILPGNLGANNAGITSINSGEIVNLRGQANGIVGIKAYGSAANLVAGVAVSGSDSETGRVTVSVFNPAIDDSEYWTFNTAGDFTTGTGNIFFGTNLGDPVIVPGSTSIKIAADRGDVTTNYISIGSSGIVIDALGGSSADIRIRASDDVFIAGGDKTANPGQTGGVINIDGGQGGPDNGFNAGDGGDVNIQGGRGGDILAGGAGDGGEVFIGGGSGSTANVVNSLSAGAGGPVTIYGGEGGQNDNNSALSNQGGNVDIYGGQGSFDFGNSVPNGDPGHVNIYGGNWGFVTPSGNIYFNSYDGTNIKTLTYDNAGNVTMAAGGSLNFVGSSSGIVQSPNNNLVIRVQDDENAAWSLYNQVTDASNVLGETRLKRDSFSVAFPNGAGNFTFANTGNLTAPGVITANTFISNAFNVVTAGNLSITSQYGLGVTGTILEQGGTLELIGNGTGAGTTGCVVVGWNSSYGTAGNVAQIYLNPADSTGNIVVTTGNTAATNYQWNFDNTGNLAAPGAISAAGNITGGNMSVSGAFYGNFYAPGVDTQIVFNDNNFANADAGFTYNKTTETVSVGNTVSASNVSVTNTISGNIISASGNITGGNIVGTHVGNITGATASLSGNVTGGNLRTSGVLNLTGGTPYTTVALSGGNIILNNGASDTPGLHFYQGNNDNFGIDVEASTLRFVKNLDEAGGVVIGRINANGNISAVGQLQGASASVTGNVTGGNVIATTTVYGNAATAFVAGTAAISGVALQMPQEGALRNLNNGSTNMYFDVSTGGSTNGQFQFRSSNSFTNVLTMSPTAFNVNTEAVVTARTASFGRLAWNSAIDTELSIDNYRFRVSNQGGIFPQIISNTGGTVNSAWTVVAARSGSAINQTGSTGALLPNNSWTSLYTSAGMDSSGDTYVCTLQDKSAGRIYRVTFMRSDNGATTGYNIIAERLI